MAGVSGFPIFDGHNDTLLDLYRPERGGGRSFFERSDKGHIDLPRAKEGGFGGGFFAVFVPPPPSQPRPSMDDPAARQNLPPSLELEYAQVTALAMTGILFRLERESEGQVKVVRTTGELETCLENGTLATILHFEGAEAIDPGLDALEVFYNAGLRSIGPVWSRANTFATGVPFRFPSTPDIGPGLTDAGKELVRACNRLGIMLDLSHLNEAGFWDIAKLSEAPLVATHSNVHALTPTPRNLTDKQLDAIKESDGMVGLNFACGFLSVDGKNDPATPISRMVEHIDYLVDRIGIDRVGLGSDFDGATMPEEIKDVAGLPHLVEALRAADYDEASMRKLTHENWVRVLKKTWKA
jgi:membrane dipeptidase